MKKFLILQQQTGEGCDYTIGCGIRYDFEEADTKEQAFDQFIRSSDFWDVYKELEYHNLDDFTGRDGYFTDRKFISVIEIVNEDQELWEQWKAKVCREVVALNKDTQEKEDKEEFERLRQKLGK